MEKSHVTISLIHFYFHMLSKINLLETKIFGISSSLTADTFFDMMKKLILS